MVRAEKRKDFPEFSGKEDVGTGIEESEYPFDLKVSSIGYSTDVRVLS